MVIEISSKSFIEIKNKVTPKLAHLWADSALTGANLSYKIINYQQSLSLIPDIVITLTPLKT
ncbi:hypothetical protein QE439_004006 [Pedobacter agri]|nr:hypothetical protein [Pedobacter agri]